MYNILLRIDGTPKQVPITTTQPSTPLKNGNKNPFPKPTEFFSFSVL